MTMKMIIFWFHTYILHIMIHCSVLYLIFCCLLSTFSCYCKELLQFSLAKIFPRQRTPTNLYHPLISFIISMDINHLINPCPTTAPLSSLVEDLQSKCQLPPISKLFVDSTPTGLSTHSQLHTKPLK